MLGGKIKQERGEELQWGLQGVARDVLTERSHRSKNLKGTSVGAGGTSAVVGHPEAGKLQRGQRAQVMREEAGVAAGGPRWPLKDVSTSSSPEPVTVTLFGKRAFACD